MRKTLTFLLAVVLTAAGLIAPASAGTAFDDYSGPYFGADNFPPGCIRDMSRSNPDNICYHQRSDMNGLDSPEIDVAILVPVSPTAERDMRIMRQSIEMWEGGIDHLAELMDLPWLAEGVNFHVTVDYFNPLGEDGGEFTTYPLFDPEIVVIATNPVGGIGIGIDPIDFGGILIGDSEAPCHGVENPFDFEQWEILPGFDSHHESRSGTYTEDCGGAGGNVCFAINGAIDPVPGLVDVFSIFDLVSHEVGHCLTIGHVGDGAEGAWGALPTNDIMAYHQDPPGLTKCVSTLDVESIATVMSRYLDVNGDGELNADDHLFANDQIGEGANPFNVQHPDDHLYASSTGSPTDCPQPDLELLPGERTDWTPAATETTPTTAAVLTVTSPGDDTSTEDATVTVIGTVEHESLVVEEELPPSTGSFADADDDASTPLTEILGLDVAVTDTAVVATISLEDMWPSTDVASATSYSLTVNGRQFDSFVRYAVDANPMTWDAGASAYMPGGTSTWDLDAKTVTFTLPLDYLTSVSVTSPFAVGSIANFSALTNGVPDDHAPEVGETIPVAAGARVVNATGLAGQIDTVNFEHPDGNTFYAEQSTLGITSELDATGHDFTLNVPTVSDVSFTLEWTSAPGGSDLDLAVTGAGDSGTDGATASNPETVDLSGVTGVLDIHLDPYLIDDPIGGATYTLTATVTPLETEDPDVDTDGDGVLDADDACPTLAGTGSDGCPVEEIANEFVLVYVDGLLSGSQDVSTEGGPAPFDITVPLAEGTHDLVVVWEDEGQLLASTTRTVTRSVAGGDGEPTGRPKKDGDGDGVSDKLDNCRSDANADQADLDDDGRGDVCDNDIDGDGYSNATEEAKGSDPRDPNSTPGNGNGKSRGKTQG